MFTNRKAIREEVLAMIKEGVITTEDVKLIKRDNLDNQREYNADNNSEIKGLKNGVETLTNKMAMMEEFLGVEEIPGTVSMDIVMPSYKKAKKGKR